MAVVTIHSTHPAMRQEIAWTIQRHFEVTSSIGYQEPRITIPLPGVTEADARTACDLYLTPHGVLHFVDA